MARFKRRLRFTILTTILAVALTLKLAVNLSAQVPNQLKADVLSNKLPNQWEFSAPRGPGAPAPDNRVGGATRGDEECIQGNAAVTALVPASGVGTTAAEYPTVYWYMPNSSASEVEFVLQDSQQQEVYSTKYALAKSARGAVAGSPGIMSLSLPAFANFSPLQLDQEYRWALAVVCDPVDRSNDVVVGGAIKRVKSDQTLAQSVQQATPPERLALYANARFWYETIGTLVDLRRDRPKDNDLTEAWNKLLTSVGLNPTFEMTADTLAR